MGISPFLAHVQMFEGLIGFDSSLGICNILQSSSSMATMVQRPPADPEPSVLTENDFLRSLGTRVRQLRNRREMTRKMVSQQAEVSERHLAQLEAGEGNVSIVLLRRIAAALQVSLADLFAVPIEVSAERQAILRSEERRVGKECRSRWSPSH